MQVSYLIDIIQFPLCTDTYATVILLVIASLIVSDFVQGLFVGRRRMQPF